MSSSKAILRLVCVCMCACVCVCVCVYVCVCGCDVIEAALPSVVVRIETSADELDEDLGHVT